MDVGQVAQVGHNNKMVILKLLFERIETLMDVDVVEAEERFDELEKFLVEVHDSFRWLAVF